MPPLIDRIFIVLWFLLALWLGLFTAAAVASSMIDELGPGIHAVPLFLVAVPLPIVTNTSALQGKETAWLRGTPVRWQPA